VNQQAEADLRQRVLNELEAGGFVSNGNGLVTPPAGDPKEVARALHAGQRAAVLRKNSKFIRQWEDDLIAEFADGREIDPTRIDPNVTAVTENRDAALFRFASLHWSVPVSHGFGRRTRFLVRDRFNGKLIGIFALGDPVFNLSARDSVIGWDSNQRKRRLYNVLDAFVMGAVGAYRQLLGGKLVAMCALANPVSDQIVKKYRNRVTEITQSVKNPRPVLITTTSALGRSSIYNRLRFNGTVLYRPVGYTQGFGHFQFSDTLFDDLLEHLARRTEVRGNRFGDGPNWRLRTLRAALESVGLPGDLLRHGIRREVFLAPLVDGWESFLRGETDQYRRLDYALPDLASFFRERWAIPRANRRPGFVAFRTEQMRLTPLVASANRDPQLPLYDD